MKRKIRVPERRSRVTPRHPAKPSAAHVSPIAGAARGGIAREILARTHSPGFRRYTRDLLLELCRIDTTPSTDVDKMRTAEAQCFSILERELSPLAFDGLRLERRPINPAILAHPNYSLLHFTKTAERPEGLSAAETYAHRTNLLCELPGSNEQPTGHPVALNAHIDVVAPYFPPAARRGAVFGRGACDDKGPVVSFVAALRVLAEVLAKAGLQLNRKVLAMFVVEEETGGNGSLSLALDHELMRDYRSLLVGECTGLRFHPANRGAVWYRAALTPPAGVSAFEMFAFVNEELEKEGASIRAESRHALFPQRPVQTCHGILGHFGEHPSRICGRVSFDILFPRPPNAITSNLVRDCLEAGLAGYVGAYGDKTKILDPSTGQPVIARHYDLRETDSGFRIEVHGATGHMGAIRERDGAITKTAHLLRSLVFSKTRLAAVSGSLTFGLSKTTHLASRPCSAARVAAATEEQSLILEGGQGFVPTHQIEEVMQRLRSAAERGAEAYLRRLGRNGRGSQVVRVTYEKLHNVAFDGNPNSVTVRNAIAAAQRCGLWTNEPVQGWTVSCDARLFATEYPDMEILTFGPGELAHAHSDREQIQLADIESAAAFLALFLLRQTGTTEGIE